MAFPINLEECVFAIGTEHGPELRQTFGHLHDFCFDGAILLNSVDKTLNVFSVDGTSSLIMTQINHHFFNLLWYVSAYVGPYYEANKNHPCLNLNVCKALTSLVDDQSLSQSPDGGNSRNVPMDERVKATLYSTANCSMRACVAFEYLESILRSAGDSRVLIYVLWRNWQTMFIKFYHKSGELKASHELTMLRSKRIFLQRRPLIFNTCYVMDIVTLRNAINDLKGIGYRHVCFADHNGKLLIVAQKDGQDVFTVVSFNHQSYSVKKQTGLGVVCGVVTGANSVNDDSDGMDEITSVSGPFRIEQIQLFVKRKTGMFHMLLLFMTPELLTLELRAYTSGSIHHTSNPGPNSTPSPQDAHNSTGIARTVVVIARESIKSGRTQVSGSTALSNFMKRAHVDMSPKSSSLLNKHISTRSSERIMEQRRYFTTTSGAVDRRIIYAPNSIRSDSGCVSTEDPTMWDVYGEEERMSPHRFEVSYNSTHANTAVARHTTTTDAVTNTQMDTSGDDRCDDDGDGDDYDNDNDDECYGDNNNNEDCEEDDETVASSGDDVNHNNAATTCDEDDGFAHVGYNDETDGCEWE